MTVCFMILAHSRPQQFLELTRIIKNSGGETVAFIDKKANLQEFETADAHFVSRRFNVNWGGYSLTRAMQVLLREALTNLPRRSSLYFLVWPRLSGSSAH